MKDFPLYSVVQGLKIQMILHTYIEGVVILRIG